MVRDTSRENAGFATRAIHRSRIEEPSRPVSTPIYMTSTFSFENAAQAAARFAGEEPGMIYSRLGNPTVMDLEERLAALEGAESCVATASGMAAISTGLLTVLKQGDHVVADEALYGCTVSLLGERLARLGVTVTFTDLSDPLNLERAFRPTTRLVFFETPANPTLKLIDIETVSAYAHERGALVMVDNTFLSPLFQRPLALGADLVVHSATKYLGGHSDVIAGALLGPRALIDEGRMTLKDYGGICEPMTAWLVTRGLMTLKVRMEAQEASARAVARFLQRHPAVSRVHYPGLMDFRQRALARRQMTGAGATLSFELEGGLEAGRAFIDAIRLFHRAVSLGGVESLACHPASTTHSPVPREQRLAASITDGLVRLSIGLEEVEDLVADLSRALDAAAAAASPPQAVVVPV
ncbi:MAG TPA: aminotransferase class I/II-fold pyridoxal phosphate-dependent enzyme [Candidatus Thermoplasmatota archaeon]|nr:aminotransferase class I/II-fold pyridoxal phosphate-dependent enzyme [Candidatus Thermoplasmatota archaeon]